MERLKRAVLVPGALRNRLLLLLLGPLLLVMAASLWWDYQTALQPSNDAYDHALADNAIAVAARLRVIGGRLQLDLPASAEAVLIADQIDQVYFTVRDASGEHLAGNADLAGYPDFSENPHFADVEINRQSMRTVTYLAPTVIGPVTVVMAETTGKRQRTAKAIVTAMLLPNLIQIAATLLVVYFGIRVGLKPLDQLGAEIARRSPHDLRPLHDELVAAAGKSHQWPDQ